MARALSRVGPFSKTKPYLTDAFGCLIPREIDSAFFITEATRDGGDPTAGVEIPRTEEPERTKLSHSVSQPQHRVSGQT